jgi:hypothetical protein
MSKKRVHLLTLTVLAASSAPLIQAGPIGQATTPANGVFASACAGNQIFGGAPTAGIAYNLGNSNAQVMCDAKSLPAGSTAIANASNMGSNYGYSYMNSATATATPGQLHLGGSNFASNATSFAGSVANVGYNDTVTFSGGTGSAFWVLPFWVDGTLTASGPSGGSQLAITAYANFNPVQPYGDSAALYSWFTAHNQTHNGDVYSSWDTETIEWGTSANDITSMTIAQFIYLAIPFTYGQQFEYGVYADIWNTQSAGQYFGPTSQTADFTHTITYAGNSFVVQGNNITSNISLTSGDGIDYSRTLNFAPEPSSIGLGASGIALLIARYRRRGRVS